MLSQIILLCRYYFIRLGMQLILYCTSTTPGHSHVFYTMLADRNTLARDNQLIAAITPSCMKWPIQLRRNETLDGDNFFLNIQVCLYTA